MGFISGAISFRKIEISSRPTIAQKGSPSGPIYLISKPSLST